MKFRLFAGILLVCAATFAATFEDAVRAFQSGDLATAEATLQSILKQEPRNASALDLLGAVYDEQKKYSDAESVYKRALVISPNSPTLLNNYANHQLATNDVNGARLTYLRVLRLDPKHANANLQLASIEVQRKSGTEALKYISALPPADRANPTVQVLEASALFLAHRDTEASALLTRLTPALESEPRLAFTAGLALASAQRYAEAEHLFAGVLEKMPSNFDVLYNLGLAAYHAGHLERAAEVLNQALQQHPQDVDTLYNLAAVDIDLKQREAALTLLAQAAKLDPSKANVQLSIAETTSALGYYADALTAYENYLKLVPDDPKARREYAFMLAANGHREDGLKLLSQIAASHPRDVTAQYEIGTLQTTADPAAALEHFNRAIAVQPDFGPARLGRGVLNFTQGKPQAALPDLEFAAKLYPDNPNVLDRLGETYSALGRNADAAEILEKASQIAPRDPRVLLHLSRALAKTGKSQESRDVMARFRAIGPDQINQIPAAGFLDFLALSPEQQRDRYRAALETQLAANPQDPALNVRYLKLLIEKGDAAQISTLVPKLLALNPPAPLAADAGRALLDGGRNADAKRLLDYAAASSQDPEIHLDDALTRFRVDGPQAGLAALDSIPESQRPGDYYLARGQMLDAAGNTSDAIAAFEKAIDNSPNRLDLYEQAAVFLTRHGRAETALKLIDKGIQSQPNDPNLLLLKSAAFAAIPRTDAAEAVLKDIEKRWPEWAPAYITYGILLEGQKRAEDAKHQLETAADLGGSSPELYLYLARATLDAAPDRIDDADKAIRQALALDPVDPWIQGTAGRIDYAKKDYQSAIGHLTEAIRLRPNYLQARFTLAQAYRAIGRKEDAARESAEFQRLRDLNPNADDQGGTAQ